MPTENAANLLAGLADLLEENEEAMVVRSTVRAALRSAIQGTTGGSGAANGFTDIYESVNADVFIDFNHHVYAERSGALNTLTPATVGGPVGTIADRTGTHIFRAPSDGARMTLQSLPNGMKYLEGGTGKYYVSDDASSEWKFLHDGTNYSVAAGVKAFNADDADALVAIFATYNLSSSNVGAGFFYDNRSVVSVEHKWRYDVARGVGGGGNIVNYTGATTPLANRRVPIRLEIDPDNATPLNRAIGDFLGFTCRQQGTISGSPSTANPFGTLHIGSVVGGAFTQNLEIFGLIFYKGTWTPNEKTAIDNFFDVDNRMRYQVTQAAANISDQAYAYESFGTMESLSDGTLLAGWRAGSAHVSTDGIIRLRSSSNSGQAWSDLAEISISGESLYDPVVNRNGSDLIASVGTYIVSPAGADKQFFYKSIDNGQTWSELAVVPVPTGCFVIRAYGKMHFVTSSLWLQPIYLFTDANVHVAQVWQSTDEGATWSVRSTIGNGLNETSIINISGSSWVAVCREQTGGTLHYAKSDDDCATWTTPVDSGLEGVSPALIRVEDSIYLLVGDRSGTGGVRLLSWSNGKLWEVATSHIPFTAAAANTDVGYPAAVVSGNSVSMICYDESAGQADQGIFFMKFDLPNFASIF